MSEPVLAVLISFGLMIGIFVPLYFVAKKHGRQLDSRSEGGDTGSTWLANAEGKDSGGDAGGGAGD